MADLIDRQAVVSDFEWCKSQAIDKDRWQEAIDRINALPSADAVEVVRCKDCRLSEHDIDITEYWCCYWDNKTLDNGYCSYGERNV